MIRKLGRTAMMAGLIPLAAACTANSSEPEPLPPPAASGDADCGAGMLQNYIGRTASEDVVAALRNWRGDKPIRVISPGMAVTMDFRPDRLNIKVDDNKLITAITCG